MENKDIWNNIETKNLVKAFLLPKSEKQMKLFLRDILTEKEINEFSKRLKAAFLLNEKIPYKEIEEKTSLSSRTIARISKWLSAKNGGYDYILKNFKNNKK